MAPPKRGHFFWSFFVVLYRASGFSRWLQLQRAQGVRFHAGRFKLGWPGLLPDGCLVLSGEGCGVPAGFVTVPMA